MADYTKGDGRLLAHLTAFERLTADDGGHARTRLEAELGSERARFLVRALTRTPSRSASESLPSAASA